MLASQLSVGKVKMYGLNSFVMIKDQSIHCLISLFFPSGRNILKCCLEADASDTSVSNGDEVTALNSTSSVNVLVTSGSLVPSLVKILLFKLNKFISHENG